VIGGGVVVQQQHGLFLPLGFLFRILLPPLALAFKLREKVAALSGSRECAIQAPTQCGGLPVGQRAPVYFADHLPLRVVQQR
jgi:hypothetical protein